MNKFSRTLLKLLFVVAAGYAMYKELQIVAVAAMIGVLLTFGWRQVKALRDAVLPVLESTRKAKLQSFELELHDRSSKLAEALQGQPSWVRFVLSDLKPNHVGVLFSLYEKERYEFPGALRGPLTILRNTGLVEHNAESLQESSLVWLSPLGKDLVSRLSATGFATALALVQNEP